MKATLLTSLALSLVFTPVASAGFYAHHDDIEDALEDFMDGYGRPDEDDCPPEDGSSDTPSDDSACEDADVAPSGQSDHEISGIFWGDTVRVFFNLLP